MYLSPENIYLGFWYSFVQTYILIFMQLPLLSLIICKSCETWKEHELRLESLWSGKKTLCEHFVSGTLLLCFYIYSMLGNPKIFFWNRALIFSEHRVLHSWCLIVPHAVLHMASNVSYGVVGGSVLLLGLSSQSSKFVNQAFGWPTDLDIIQEDDSFSPADAISVLCRWDQGAIMNTVDQSSFRVSIILWLSPVQSPLGWTITSTFKVSSSAGGRLRLSH